MSNFIAYDLENLNADRARQYNMSFYRLSKIGGRYARYPTEEELKKSIDNTISFVDLNCVEKALDYCIKLKGDEYKDKKGNFLEYNLQLHAHSGSGFDCWIVLNILPCDKRIVNIIKNGKGIIELKVFN